MRHFHIQVKELREGLGPLTGRSLKYCTDGCLRRYLEARNWNVDKSKKMLEESLKWRASYKPEEIRWVRQISTNAQVINIYLGLVWQLLCYLFLEIKWRVRDIVWENLDHPFYFLKTKENRKYKYREPSNKFVADSLYSHPLYFFRTQLIIFNSATLWLLTEFCSQYTYLSWVLLVFCIHCQMAYIAMKGYDQ